MRQVADNTYVLGSKSHNFYVLTEGSAATVIDLGCSGEWGALAAGLAELNLTSGDVERVLVTHAHADHFGLAKRAQEEGLRVEVHPDEETRALGTYAGRFAVDASELPKFNVHALRSFMPMISRGVMKMEHVEEIGLFETGTAIDIPGRPIPVHTPGHTEGHAMFHCPDLGVLFTGDGLVTKDLLSSSTGPQIMEQRFNLDTGQAKTSLENIRGLHADLILPGHGDPWRGTPAAAVNLAVGI